MEPDPIYVAIDKYGVTWPSVSGASADVVRARIAERLRDSALAFGPFKVVKYLPAPRRRAKKGR